MLAPIPLLSCPHGSLEALVKPLRPVYRRTFAQAIFAILLVSTFPVTLWAEEPTPKAQALVWIDDFASVQILFSPEDVEKLKTKVSEMSDEEAAKWWEQSQPHRELLDSDQWQETRAWLKEFLKVQAIYSDEEVRYFQSEAFAKAQESPLSLKEVMDSVTARRKKLAARAQRSAQTRQQLLAMGEAYRQQQVQLREAALKDRPDPRPYNPVVVRLRPVRYNRPLVTSLDAARWTILRHLYPRW